MPQKNTQGFALLFTVLIVSLMLTLAVGISSITFKQNLLSGLAKDSQIAFYQADAAVECGKYYDTQLGVFPLGTVPSRPTITCGSQKLTLDPTSTTDYLIYKENTGNTPCFSVTFDKRDGINYHVQGRGFNICDASPRQVERGFEYVY